VGAMPRLEFRVQLRVVSEGDVIEPEDHNSIADAIEEIVDKVLEALSQG